MTMKNQNRFSKSTLATAVSAALLSAALGSPEVIAQSAVTNASGSTTVNATNSGAGTLSASGSTTVNAVTVSGSGSASPTQSGATTNNGGTTAGSGLTSPGATTTPVSPAPTTAAAPTSTTPTTSTTSPTPTTTTAPSATSSSTSTSNAGATATNDVDISLAGGTVITGDNNIVGNNNSVNTTTAMTNTSATNGTATGTTDARSSMPTGTNGASLQQGLRTGSEITLTGPSGERAAFTPPTGKMGNGEAERAITLANRDLASAGITNPTPQQTEAALMGGTVTNAQGEKTDMPGVLQLRSQGMGWGQIANTIDVHPSQSERGAANSMRGRDRGAAAGAVAGVSAPNDRAGAAAAAQSGASDDRFGRTLTSSRSHETNRSDAIRNDARATASASERAGINSRDQGQGARVAVGAREHDNRPGHAFSRSDDRKNDRGSVAARDSGNGTDSGKRGKR
jgi:hypothetical protein